MSNKSLTDLAKEFSAEVENDFEWRPHVFPKYPAPVLIEQTEKTLLRKMHFGLIPYFEKNEKPKMVFHNARVETIAEKPSFKSSFKSKRCAIPIESFFEYIWEDDKTKWIANFSSKDQKTLVAAGVWNTWKPPSGKSIETFTMITREPPKFILDTGHDRCPYFINAEKIHQWLNAEESDPANLLKTLTAIASEPDFKLMRVP